MNSAQLLSLVRHSPLELITFDGDVTLYDDGQSLRSHAADPVIERLIGLLAHGINVGIVTAAGYSEASRYHERLHGLLERARALALAGTLHTPAKLVVVGGESNFLFEFDAHSAACLRPVARPAWMLPEMLAWDAAEMQALLDVAEAALRACIAALDLDGAVLRRERAVGLIPSGKPGARRFAREQLEETVLVTQQMIEASAAGQRVPFCAFNGGGDVFVDIGDKSWGVRACQNYLGGISGSRTLHVGDQFLSAGANDFKARLACTTAWIASPLETVQLLDELSYHREQHTER